MLQISRRFAGAFLAIAGILSIATTITATDFKTVRGHLTGFFSRGEHDSDTGIPEPATLILVGSVCFATGFRRQRP